MSYQAYQKAQTTSENPSQVEYRLFAQVTNALLKVQDVDVRDLKVIDALDWNRRMWSTLSSDCGAKGNQLPDNLRASIISLSIWVSKHTSLVMRGEESMEDLININRTIMEGLAAQDKLQKQAATSLKNQELGQENIKPINSVL